MVSCCRFAQASLCTTNTSCHQIQTSIYAARGLLVESTEPTWLYGTSSEHSVFYQYNFNGARNVFAAMIQSESPYFQPKPQAPSPFNDAVGALPGDPDYNQTAGVPHESWALVMRKSADVLIAGAGLYSWSSSFDEDCGKLRTPDSSYVTSNPVSLSPQSTSRPVKRGLFCSKTTLQMSRSRASSPLALKTWWFKKVSPYQPSITCTCKLILAGLISPTLTSAETPQSRIAS